jgi:hypothetical protein
MNTFIIKIILMPLVVAFVTLVSRKWGNNIGGILASLPFVAGAILLFIALEQGVVFAAATVPGIMVGILGWIVFCVVYIVVGQRFNVLFSTLLGFVACICWSLIIQNAIPLLSLPVWFCLTLIALYLGLKYFPQVTVPEQKEYRKLNFEIPLRMLVITIFVVVITYFANVLGTTWSGILTPFPIITSVLVVFTHYTQGIAQVRKVFIGLFTGMFGYTLFLYLQAYLLLSTSIFNAFLYGFLADILLTLLLKKQINKIAYPLCPSLHQK